MGTEVIALNRQRLIIGTSDWFYSMRHAERDLVRMELSLKNVLANTLDITCRAIAGGRTLYAVPSGGEYHNMLTQYLLQIDARYYQNTNPDVIALAAEVSTYFYNELTALFRFWQLTNYQIATMKIVGWIADDLIVEVIY